MEDQVSQGPLGGRESEQRTWGSQAALDLNQKLPALLPWCLRTAYRPELSLLSYEMKVTSITLKVERTTRGGKL